MMTSEELINLIAELATELRLSAIRSKCLELIHQAESSSMTYDEFLYFILKEELDSRKKNRLNSIKKAGLSKPVKLDSFQLKEGYGLDERKLKILRKFYWLLGRYNLVVLGGLGTGKTTLLKGLVTEAFAEGFHPFFCTFDDAIKILQNKDTDTVCKRTYEYITNKCDLLAVDGIRKLGIGV